MDGIGKVVSNHLWNVSQVQPFLFGFSGILDSRFIVGDFEKWECVTCVLGMCCNLCLERRSILSISTVNLGVFFCCEPLNRCTGHPNGVTGWPRCRICSKSDTVTKCRLVFGKWPGNKQWKQESPCYWLFGLYTVYIDALPHNYIYKLYTCIYLFIYINNYTWLYIWYIFIHVHTHIYILQAFPNSRTPRKSLG